MSRKHLATSRAVTLATVTALTIAAALTACSTGGGAPAQSLEVAYSDGDDSSTADISVEGLRCSETQGMRTFIGGGDVDGRAAVTVSVLDGQATVAVHLEDDRWFISSGAAEADAESITFDGFTGSVVGQGADLDITGVIDEAATLSGTLSCD